MRFRTVLLFCSCLGTAALPALAAGGNEVRGLVMAGEIMPFEAIRSRVVSQVRGEYMGAQFDAGTRTYRFRFMVDGSVINVDVDARTGQRLNRRQAF